MRRILAALAALVAIVGVIALVGYVLPVRHEASRSAEFKKSPSQVFALIENPAAYHEWWEGADVKSEVIERDPPRKLVTRIVGETQFGGTWTFEVAPTTAGSRLAITERGEIYNVIFRALAKYVFGYTSTMDSFLEAAKLKLET